MIAKFHCKFFKRLVFNKQNKYFASSFLHFNTSKLDYLIQFNNYSNLSILNITNKEHTKNHISKLNDEKPRILLLGTGWASFHFLKAIDTRIYNIYIISPRNYFVFTPLLPSVCVGSLSAESCVDSIREYTENKTDSIKYFEANCTNVDFNKKSVICETYLGASFSIEYDYLIMGLGTTSNTFGIKGVQENAYFLKELNHALAIRKKIIENFETASIPGTSLSKIQQLLNFFIVGGGPTGVEVAAELADFINENIKKIYPDLIHYYQISLIEMSNKLLPMFSEDISQFTKDNFQNSINVNVLLEHSVVEIDTDFIYIKPLKKEKNSQIIKKSYGFILWASGIAQVDLSKKLISNLDAQKGNRIMKVTPHFLLKGTKDVYAFGDCASIEPLPFKNFAEEIFQKTGKTQIEDVWIKLQLDKWAQTFPQFESLKRNPSILKSESMNLKQFLNFADEIDKNYRPPPPTAQVAKKSGIYLASIFNNFLLQEDKKVAPHFVDKWDGTLAYIGGKQAVANLPYFNINIKGGFYSSTFWKVAYMYMQTSYRNIIICCSDWIKVFFTGRSSAKYQ